MPKIMLIHSRHELHSDLYEFEMLKTYLQGFKITFGY